MKTRLVYALAYVALFLAACDDKTSTASEQGADASYDAALADGASDASLGPLCDPRDPQCEQDQKCVTSHWDFAVEWPAPRCVPELGDKGLGEGDACFSTIGVSDYCGTNLACTNYGTGEGFCRMLCNTTGADCGPSGSVCATVDPISGFMLCLPRCDVDEDCGPVGFFTCLERDGLKFCDSARAQQ